MDFIKYIFSFFSSYNNENTESNNDSIENGDKLVLTTINECEEDIVDIEANEIQMYHITADIINSTYQTDLWEIELSTRHIVSLLITTIYRWGTFEIELTESEKQHVLNQKTIVLNEYNCSSHELWDPCQQGHTIKQKDKYSIEELKEINKLLFSIYSTAKEAEDGYIYDSDAEYSFNIDTLEENGWVLQNTIYGIDSRCVLNPIINP